MTLAQSAIERAGLADLVSRCIEGTDVPRSTLSIPPDVDVLALGAAADAVRAAHVGDEVHVHTTRPTPSDLLIVLSHATVPEAARENATTLLRHLAMTRLSAPRGARICLDFGDFGIEIAQVALSFGVTDIVGPMKGARSLPTLSDAAKPLVKRAEIAGYITRAKRTSVFVDG
jgi:hypothetical protein